MESNNLLLFGAVGVGAYLVYINWDKISSTFGITPVTPVTPQANTSPSINSATQSMPVGNTFPEPFKPFVVPDGFTTGVTPQQAGAWLAAQGYSLLGMTPKQMVATYDKYKAFDLWHAGLWGANYDTPFIK